MSILKCGLGIEAVNVGLRPYEMSERGAHRHGNRRAVPSFAKARASGRRIAAAHIESVMNPLINHRSRMHCDFLREMVPCQGARIGKVPSASHPRSMIS